MGDLKHLLRPKHLMPTIPFEYVNAINRVQIGTRGTEDCIALPQVVARETPTTVDYDDRKVGDGNDGALTIAELLTGILRRDMQGTGEWELPSATTATAGVNGVQDNDGLDFFILNENTGGLNDLTISAGIGGTFVGNTIVPSASVTSSSEMQCGHFRLIFNDVSAPSYTVFRLS